MISQVSGMLAVVKQWFPETAMDSMGDRRRPLPRMEVDFEGRVGIAPSDDDRIEAYLDGELKSSTPPEAHAWMEESAGIPLFGRSDRAALPDRIRIEARRMSSGCFGRARPFVWIQLLDDRGAPLTLEVFLGHAIGVEYRVHSRLSAEAVRADSAAARIGVGARFLRGLYARIVLRTYCDPNGPRFQSEVLLLAMQPLEIEDGVRRSGPAPRPYPTRSVLVSSAAPPPGSPRDARPRLVPAGGSRRASSRPGAALDE